MFRDHNVYLEDILTSIRKIKEFTKGMTLAVLSKDAKTLDAVIRNLEVIGEAVKRLPDSCDSNNRILNGKRLPDYAIS